MLPGIPGPGLKVVSGGINCKMKVLRILSIPFSGPGIIKTGTAVVPPVTLPILKNNLTAKPISITPRGQTQTLPVKVAMAQVRSIYRVLLTKPILLIIPV